MRKRHAGTPWNDLLQLPIEGRQVKPRRMGLTMVIDKGVGIGAMDDILRTAGDYIDFWKLGFGTSLLRTTSSTNSLLACNVDILCGIES